jgi:hypothetical protein
MPPSEKTIFPPDPFQKSRRPLCDPISVVFPPLVSVDGFVKSLERPNSVIPAKAGIQSFQGVLDPGFRRGDGLFDFLQDHHQLNVLKKDTTASVRPGG